MRLWWLPAYLAAVVCVDIPAQLQPELFERQLRRRNRLAVSDFVTHDLGFEVLAELERVIGAAGAYGLSPQHEADSVRRDQLRRAQQAKDPAAGGPTIGRYDHTGKVTALSGLRGFTTKGDVLGAQPLAGSAQCGTHGA